MSIRINDLTVRFKNGVVAVNKASLEIPKGKPNENCVLDNDITLEDAYIYLTNS